MKYAAGKSRERESFGLAHPSAGNRLDTKEILEFPVGRIPGNSGLFFMAFDELHDTQRWLRGPLRGVPIRP
jgi:hypothetical protein